MDRPTKGKIYIEDNDSKIESLYSIIGFCPQENVLVDCLTVLEHLCIFGMVFFYLLKIDTDTFNYRTFLLKSNAYRL